MPLGYAWNGLEPDPLLACDAADCRADDDNVNLPVQRLNCGHTFHKVCLGKSSHCNDHGYSMSNRTSCPICSVQLPLRAERLASSFNKSLVGGTDDNDGEVPSADDWMEMMRMMIVKTQMTVAVLCELLLKAKHPASPHAALYKYSDRNSKPGISNSEAAPESVNTGHVCATCGRVCKTKGD